MQTWRAEQWREVRAKGKRAFLVRYGFLGRGLPLGALIAVAVEASRGTPIPAAFGSLSFLGLLVFSVAVMTLSGCLSANVNWNQHERRYGGA